MGTGRAFRAAIAACGTMLMTAPAALGQADVIVGDLTGPLNSDGIGPRLWGSVGDTTAYSVGTTSCNTGDVALDWFQFNPNHPVIAQNMFRIKDGRIEQIGMAWVKHGLCALQQNLCGGCQPVGPGCQPLLGVGCSDPYDAELNGEQQVLGRRSEVNATTGAFTWPFTGGGSGGTLGKRIQVNLNDLDPNQNDGAVYLAEGAYIAKDDAAAGNGDNNNSYRTFGVGTLTGAGYQLFWNNPTVREAPAIFAWQDHGLGLNQPDPDVNIVPIDPISLEDSGLMYLGYKVSENDDGTWHYEYAFQNVNSDRALGSVTIESPPGTSFENIGFKDIDYHSGETLDSTDWIISALSTANAIEWRSPETFAENPDSNAMRWGTLYNFWFDSDGPPVPGKVGITYFKPGDPQGIPVPAVLPGAVPCPPDFNGDGAVNVLDFIAFQAAFTANFPSADCDGDGEFTIQDFTCFSALFVEGC